MSYLFSDFVNKPKEFFICQGEQGFEVEKRGFGIKKWVYTLFGSKRYDLQDISRKIEAALKDPLDSKFLCLGEKGKEQFVQKLNLQIASHNERAEKISVLFKRNHIKQIDFPAALRPAEEGIKLGGTQSAHTSSKQPVKKITGDMSKEELIKLLPSILRRQNIAGDYKLSKGEANLMLLVDTQVWQKRQEFIEQKTDDPVSQELVDQFIDGLKPDERKGLADLLKRISESQAEKMRKEGDVESGDMDKVD